MSVTTHRVNKVHLNTQPIDPVDTPGSVDKMYANSKVRTYIPPHFQAIYERFGDKFNMGSAAPTRQMLDENEFTKDLPETEKAEILKYWTPYRNVLQMMAHNKAQRERVTDLAIETTKKSEVIRKDTGLDLLALPQQLRGATQLFAEQIFEGSIRLVAMNVDDVTDSFGLELMRHRIMYVKEFIYLHKQLMEVAARVDEYNGAGGPELKLSDEAKAILAKADAVLKKHKKKPKKAS